MKKTYEQDYCSQTDRTVIWEEVWADEETLVSIELVGWYFGRPYENAVKDYADRAYKAVFDEHWEEAYKRNPELYKFEED